MAKSRRGNGEGTIYKQPDGRWRAVVSLPNGKRKYLSGKTREDTGHKLTALLKQLQDGVMATDGRLTVKVFADDWLEGVRNNLRPKTAESYEWAVEKHILPRIGRLKLGNVGPQHLEAMYRDMKSGGKAPQTIRNVHRVAGTIFAKALRMGFITRNPVPLADTPKVPRKEKAVFDREDLQSFLKTASDHRLGALFTLAATCGARSGELLGLRWTDVDFTKNEIHIRVSLHLTSRGFDLAEPKTKGSQRKLALSRVAIQALKRHRVRQNEAALRLGTAWTNNWDLVFTNEVGNPLDRKNVLRRDLRPLLAEAGLPPVTFHDLRHIAASWALDQGVPLTVVSRALGHTDLTTTARVYMHQIKGAEEKVAAAFDSLAV
jgi:integrase